MKPKFYFSGFRVISLRCESFVFPTPVGERAVMVGGSATVRFPNPDEDPNDREAIVTVQIDAQGGSDNRGKSDLKEKYFSIQISAEGTFKANEGEKLSNEDWTPALTVELTSYVYPIALLTFGNLADQMGYPGVRPDLAFEALQTKVTKIVPRKALRKRGKTAPTSKQEKATS